MNLLNYFKLKENNTTIKTEFFAGLTIFFSMVYILMVNATMFTDPFGNGTNVLGVSYNAIYISTAISAVVGCFLMGILANVPLALASGMGLNAFFVYTACIGFGLTYANALVLILLDGLLFVLFTLTGTLKFIFSGIPKSIRSAISVGIGLFIALLALQSSGVVIKSSSTGIALTSFNILKMSWAQMISPIISIVGVFIISIMAKRGVKGYIFLGIIISMCLYYLLGLTAPTFYDNLHISFISPFSAIKEFYNQSFNIVFTQGFDFSAYIAKNGTMNLILTIFTTSLAFCLIDIFDTLGTIYATSSQGNLLDKEGEIPYLNKAMLADSISTCTGAICGISTVTAFVESTTGIAEGGRTGLTAIFTGLFFFIALFLSPLGQLVPSCATATALLYVGMMMMSSIKDIDWKAPNIAIPAFLTIIMMPFAYNISYGIAFGLISFIGINIFTKNKSEVKLSTWILALLFIITMLFTH